jgi:hypothetical protein
MKIIKLCIIKFLYSPITYPVLRAKYSPRHYKYVLKNSEGLHIRVRTKAKQVVVRAKTRVIPFVMLASTETRVDIELKISYFNITVYPGMDE